MATPSHQHDGDGGQHRAVGTGSEGFQTGPGGANSFVPGQYVGRVVLWLRGDRSLPRALWNPVSG